MKSHSEIEGVWNGYSFHIAGSAEYPIISEFLSKFYYRDEPITVLLGYSDAKAKDVDCVVKQFLEDSLSLYAVDNETGEVAAVRIGYDSRRAINLTSTFKTKDNLKVQVLKDSLVEMAKHKLEATYPESIYAMGFLSSVSTGHRGKGLASEIYVRSLNHFKHRGFCHTRNFFSSKFTMKIVQKLRYEELSRVFLGVLQYPEDGRLVFEKADVNFYATFMARRLDDENNN